jgi:uncharacterized protein YdaU (DUF1376 family)
MPFHIDRWKGSPHVQAMRATARAGYLYLLTAAWQTEDCSLPTDDEELGILAGLTDEEWKEHGARIRGRFTVAADGRMFNTVLVGEWSDAKHIFESRQKNAHRTNSVRTPNEGRIQNVQRAARNANTGTGTDTGTKKHEDTKTLELVSLASLLPNPFITLPLNDGSEYAISEDAIREWQLLYPAIDVKQELRKYKGWAMAKPAQRKTHRGILGSVNTWLAKSHDNAGNRNGGPDGTNRAQRRTDGNIAGAAKAFERIIGGIGAVR